MVRRSLDDIMVEAFCLYVMAGFSTFPPPSALETIIKGISIETKDGRNKSLRSDSVVTFSLIQSIMVVTSPVGVHAPPLFAAMMIMLA